MLNLDMAESLNDSIDCLISWCIDVLMFCFNASLSIRQMLLRTPQLFANVSCRQWADDTCHVQEAKKLVVLLPLKWGSAFSMFICSRLYLSTTFTYTQTQACTRLRSKDLSNINLYAYDLSRFFEVFQSMLFCYYFLKSKLPSHASC